MGETPAEQLHAMTQKWDAMYESGARDGKALLLLAFRLRQFSQKYVTDRKYAHQFSVFVQAHHATQYDRAIIISHVVCARECLEARAYRDALNHTQKALNLCLAHKDTCMDLMKDVLFCQKDAWCGLGEPTEMLSTVKVIAKLPSLPGHARVEALCEAAATEITLQDFRAAVTTAREALSVDGVPQASRNIARMKLGVALLGADRGDDALLELERCECEWTMSGEGTRWNRKEMKEQKVLLDQTLEKVRRLEENKAGMVDTHIRQDLLSDEYLRTLRQAQGATGFAQLQRVSKDATPMRTDLLSDEYVRMQQTFDRMHDQEFPDGNALLDLAAKISYRTTEEAERISRQCNVPKSSFVELVIGAQRNMFDAHTCRACDCVDAGKYQAALEHANEAIQLGEMHGGLWEEKMAIIVLDVVKRALKGLGERREYLTVAKRRARAMVTFGRPGDERVDALCEIVAAQIDFGDYADAEAVAREALAVDAPPVSRQYARLKLGTALMTGGRTQEALREFRQCESEWTASIDGTETSEAELARMRHSLDHNLSVCRLRLAEKRRVETPTSGTSEEGQTLHPAMKLVTGGDFENAAVLAEKTAENLLSDICNSSGLALKKKSNLPSCQARAFTLVNSFLLDDHRAAIWLEAMQEAVKLGGREPLDDACPICLQSIAWPAELSVGTRVTVHGLKKATNRNGDQGVVERMSVGPECRVQVRFRRNAAPEEGVLTVEERKAVLRGLLEQVDKPCPSSSARPEEVRRAAEASLSAPEGSLDQDAVNEVVTDMLIRAGASDLRRSIANEIARLDKSSTYSLRIRSANLKPSKGYVEASRRALITGCMHVYHARCIKRAVDEGQRTCPVCGDSSHFAETLVECGAMPSWDRPSWEL
jgi:hypothetical protein